MKVGYRSPQALCHLVGEAIHLLSLTYYLLHKFSGSVNFEVHAPHQHISLRPPITTITLQKIRPAEYPLLCPQKQAQLSDPPQRAR
jgi:hypothetical protein